jgi:hypothetical protein
LVAKICQKGVSSPLFNGLWLFSNTRVDMPCWMIFFDVSSNRWLPLVADEQWQVWGVTEVKVCLPLQENQTNIFQLYKATSVAKKAEKSKGIWLGPPSRKVEAWRLP